MKLVSINTLIVVFLVFSQYSMASQMKENQMTVNGSFEVDMTPIQDDTNPAGRMLINKQYVGGLEGTGVGQMLSKRTQKGASAYSAVEEFAGTVDGKSGGFTLIHIGHMSARHQQLEVTILDGSGTGDLEGIKGSMEIIQEAGGHKYVLTYEL